MDQQTAAECEGGSRAETAADAPGAEAAQPAAAEPQANSEALSAENAALKDRMLRALADMENMRRRTEREVADAKTYGVASFARDMLTVADNIRRALESVPLEVREALEGPLKTLVEGIELTERDFLTGLGRFGVKKLEPLGQKFDPNMHQAMYEVPDETVPSGTVTQVVQAGYAIGERVLRPALVGVAKGGPKAAPETAAAKPNGGA